MAPQPTARLDSIINNFATAKLVPTQREQCSQGFRPTRELRYRHSVASSNPLAVMPFMESDLQRVETELITAATSSDDYLTAISTHLISAGGKRVRPGFSIAAAATTHQDHQPASREVIRGAVAVELVHLGSLYHDDVMDDALVRRNIASVNAAWGNLKAILAGDFLLARASEIAASLGTEVAGLLAATITRLCEGQVLELEYTYRTDRTESLYYRSIEGKTASLLATACRIGALVSGVSQDRVDALTHFGHCYGMAFQIVDDVLDLVSDEAAMGKPTGHDMAEGVYTLPVILAAADEPAVQALLTDAMSEPERLEAVRRVRSGPWIGAAIDVASRFATEATDALASVTPSSGSIGLNAAAKHLLDSVASAAAHA